MAAAASSPRPGPIADRVYRFGFRVATVGGLAALGAGFALGHLTLPTLVFVLMTLFPVYLLFVAVALALWLGYDTDRTDLQPVTEDGESEKHNDPWKNWPW